MDKCIQLRYELPRHDDSFNITTDVIEHPLDNGLHLASRRVPSARTARRLAVERDFGSRRFWIQADGNRVEIAREAANAIRRSMGNDDRMSVVHFDDRVKGRLTVKDRAPNDGSISSSIDSLTPEGSTNVQAG